MARNHQLAPLVALFAAQRPCALRTAQWHAKKETEEWRAFLARQGGSALTAAKPTKEGALALVNITKREGPLDFGEIVSFEGLDLPEEMEARHAQLWRLCMTAAEDSARKGDATGALLFAKQAAESRKAYQDARNARVRAEIETRQLVPAAEFDRYAQEIARLAEVMLTLDLEVAQMANPERPDVAATAIRWWKINRLNPAVEVAIQAAA